MASVGVAARATEGGACVVLCAEVARSHFLTLRHSGDHIGPTRTTSAVSPARQLGVHAGTPFWSVGARGLGIGDERAKVYGLSAEFASTGPDADTDVSVVHIFASRTLSDFGSDPDLQGMEHVAMFSGSTLCE